MDNKQLNNRIRTAVFHAVPDVLPSVLADCETQKGTVIIMKERNRTARRSRALSAAVAACFALLIGVGGFAGYQANYMVDSTISFDVNPSIEISLNQKEKVLAVTPLNAEGETVVGQMDFKGSSLDLTVNALIGSMLRNGYLNALSNSILVSVNNADAEKCTRLQEQISQEVSSLLNTESFTGAVLSQSLTGAEDSLSTLAETYGITAGKARLVQELVGLNPLYTEAELAGLSINELNLLLEAGHEQPESLTARGSASDKAYIGEEQALSAALAHAGLQQDDIRLQENHLDYEDGAMVYELEFWHQGYEYEYDVDALTGTVRKADKEREDDPPRQKDAAAAASGQTASENAAPGEGIGKAKAIEIALAHAGLSESSIRDLDAEKDREHGLVVYEVDFEAGSYEYDYEINAVTGEIVKHKKEWAD